MTGKWTTPEGLKEFKVIAEGHRISWVRNIRNLRRGVTIYPAMLTPEQQQRLSQIEQELLDLAYTAEDETRTKLVMEGKQQP